MLYYGSNTNEHQCVLHHSQNTQLETQLDWIEQRFTSPPTQYRIYGRRFLQVKRPNQQYQSTEGTYSTQDKSNTQ